MISAALAEGIILSEVELAQLIDRYGDGMSAVSEGLRIR